MLRAHAITVLRAHAITMLKALAITMLRDANGGRLSDLVRLSRAEVHCRLVTVYVLQRAAACNGVPNAKTFERWGAQSKRKLTVARETAVVLVRFGTSQVARGTLEVTLSRGSTCASTTPSSASIQCTRKCCTPHFSM
jgi:hypothetical protein